MECYSPWGHKELDTTEQQKIKLGCSAGGMLVWLIPMPMTCKDKRPYKWEAELEGRAQGCR